MAAQRSLLERFEEKYIPEPNSGCWLWTAGVNNTGYGLFFYERGMSRLAHRASYLLHVGEIPEGLCVLHRCDTPCCVRPDHLWLGTKADNSADCVAKGRASGGSSPGSIHPMAKLNEQIALQIFNSEGVPRVIAEHFGVSRETVRDIKNKRYWKHIHD